METINTGNGAAHPITNLREIARRLSEGEQLPEPLAAWLGSSLHSFFRSHDQTLDDAFGLRWGRGGVPWWMEEAIRTRDSALRMLAARLPGGISLSERARIVRTNSIRYASSAWLHDRDRADMPARYHGTDQEWLWRAFKSGATMPLGERRLTQILGE